MTIDDIKRQMFIDSEEVCGNTMIDTYQAQEYVEQAYNKAIDDFASKLIMHFSDWELSNAPFNDDETDGIGEIICETIENAIGGVEEIAEQLKEGGVDASGI